MTHIENAIQKMRAPSQMSIICIDITNKCDLACSNCTRLLANQDAFWDMSPPNFRLAARSLADYPGIIAVIGGNPCMHPQFAQLCQIFEEEIPQKERRGLWTNNFFKHQEISRKTFGIFNLNSHGDERGIKSVTPFKEISWFHEGTSDHSPLLTAIRDLYAEEEMWKKISACDINQNWSATVIQNKGQLRYYFCEVAASFDLARGTDNGFPLQDGWWRKPMNEFAQQIKHFCPGCGVPAKLKGHRDRDEIDTYSISNADIAEKTVAKKRKIIKINSIAEVGHIDVVTDYSPLLKDYKTQTLPKKKKKKKFFKSFVKDIFKRPFN